MRRRIAVGAMVFGPAAACSAAPSPPVCGPPPSSSSATSASGSASANGCGLLDISRESIGTSDGSHAPKVDLDSFPDTYRAGFGDAVARARRVVETDRFRQVLRSVEKLGVGDGTTTSGADVESQLLGRTVHLPIHVRYFYSAYHPADWCSYNSHETAHTVPDSTLPANSGTDPGGATHTCIQPDVVTRADTASQAAMACAINTIVHEWTHSIVDARGWMIFTDGGHKHAKDPLVSYTVGSVAQCVYMELATGDARLDAKNMAQCIQDVGTRVFDISTCKDGWFDVY